MKNVGIAILLLLGMNSAAQNIYTFSSGGWTDQNSVSVNGPLTSSNHSLILSSSYDIDISPTTQASSSATWTTGSTATWRGQSFKSKCDCLLESVVVYKSVGYSGDNYTIRLYEFGSSLPSASPTTISSSATLLQSQAFTTSSAAEEFITLTSPLQLEKDKYYFFALIEGSSVSGSWSWRVNKANNQYADGYAMDIRSSGSKYYIYNYDLKFSVNYSFNINNLTVGSTAVSSLDGKVSLSGNLVNNGTLNLSASSSGYSQLKVGGTITNSGTISQSQYIGSTGHHGISSPMTSGFTTTSGTSSTLYGYNATTGAWDMSPTTSTVGAGFFAPVQASNGFQSAAGGFSVTGTPNTSHTHSLGYAANTATGGSGSGWNLIGNPYTCGLDWTSVTKTNVNNAYYVWDAYNGTYQYYSGSALTGTYLAASSILSGVIPPMQAFWVQTTASGGSIVSTMASDGTVASSPTFYKTAPDNLILYAEDLNDPSLSDAMWITHAAGYTNDFEGDQDAWKRTNYGGLANIYSYHDGEKLAINAMDLSSTTSIPVGVGAPEAGRKYRIVLEQLVNNQAYQVVLEDKLMNSFTDITSEGYVFTYGPWQNEDPRFVLHINQSTVGLGEQTAPEVKVYQQGERLVIHGEAQKHSSYTLLRADGRILESGSLSAGMASIKAPQGGMYIIQIDGVSPVAQRIVIQ